MKSLIFSVLFFYQIEKDKCEYHLFTNDEFSACKEFVVLCKILEQKQEKIVLNSIRIHSDFRYRVGITKTNTGFHVFKLKISCESKNKRLAL